MKKPFPNVWTVHWKKILNLKFCPPFNEVRMAEWSKALRSGLSLLLKAWVRIPLLTKLFFKIILHSLSLSFTGYSFWDRLRNSLHKFTWIVLSDHKLLGKYWQIYGQLLNIVSSYGWCKDKVYDNLIIINLYCGLWMTKCKVCIYTWQWLTEEGKKVNLRQKSNKFKEKNDV